MGNRIACSGVYSNMRGMSLFLLLSLTAMAQPSPRQDPLDTAIQAIWQSGNHPGTDVAALRNQARTLLQNASPASPRFADWTQQVAQAYQNVGLNRQALAVLNDSYSRAAGLGDTHSTRIQLLSTLAGFWEQDGNLLRAVAYLEKLAADQAAAPPPSSNPGGFAATFISINGIHRGYSSVGGPFSATYDHLFYLYQRLGRPEAAAGVAEKIRQLVANNPQSLASFYEQHGQVSEAAAIFRQIADGATDPQAKSYALQSLANIYARQEDFTQAAATMQQAIAAQSSSGDSLEQNLWMRQTVAGHLRRAGKIEQADQLQQDLLQQSEGRPIEAQVVSNYAMYLADSDRAVQGEAVLKEYLGNHPSLDTNQRMSALFSLSNLANRNNDPKASEQYREQAQALQRASSQQREQLLIGPEIQKAQTAVNQRQWEDAYTLAMNTLERSAGAADGQQADWAIPNIATALASNKEPAKADQLFRRLLTVVQTMPTSDTRRHIEATQQYARFLMGQPERWDEVPAALEQLNDLLIEANGPGSGTLIRTLDLKLHFAMTRQQWPEADTAARALLEFQQSLSGNTSDAYLSNLETAINAYSAAGDFATALTYRRSAIKIADLLATPSNSWNRSQTRINAAMLLAQLGQFDEAEELANQAVALAAAQRASAPYMQQQLEQIRKMRQSQSAVRSPVAVKFQ